MTLRRSWVITTNTYSRRKVAVGTTKKGSSEKCLPGVMKTEEPENQVTLVTQTICLAKKCLDLIVDAFHGHSSPAMTRHYTHVGELAAGRAVALLPSVMSDAKPEQNKRTPEAILSEARAIAEGMTSKTWKAKREALLALLA